MASLATLAAAPSAPAEPVEGTHLFSIEVTGTPEGLLGAAGVRMRDATNAELVFDVIEHVHFLARSPAGVEFYAETVAAFLNEWRRARRRDGSVSLEAAQEDSRARDRLEEFLEMAGFLLLRNSGRLFVRPDPDDDAKARREALAAAGFPIVDLDVRMNEGEAIAIEPRSFAIPSPLPAEVWRNVIFDRPVPGERLAFRLLADRQAAFLYYGLLSMAPETVRFLAGNPELLRELYDRDASAFAAYGRSLVVVNGRVRTPGGGAASILWQRLVGEPIDRPGEFFKAVLRHDDGPFPFLYDAIASLDAPQQRFALGVGLDDRDQRRAFARLYEVMAENLVFSPGTPWPRGFPDPSVLLSQVRADDSGQPSGPAWEELWEEALDGIELPRNASRDVQGVHRSDPIEASRLAERVFRESPWAAARMAAFLFAQRRFTDVETRDLRHVLTTLRGFPLFQSLVSTLDRMGVQSPRTYATAVLHAASLNRVEEPEDSRDALSQFQGALALLDRLRHVRSLSEDAAADLSASAVAVRLHETRGYEGRMAGWTARELLPALGADPPDGDSEDGEFTDPAVTTGAGDAPAPRERIVLKALAGALEDDGRGHRVTTTWEGFSYVTDLRGATLTRLFEARQEQSGASLDTALDLWAIADALAGGPRSVEEVRGLVERLRSVASALPAREGPVGPVIVSHYLGRVYSDLERIQGPDDIARRVPEAAGRLLRLSDAVLGDVLRALVYAAYIGDPRSGVLGSGDLSVRHDFGDSALDPTTRDSLRTTAWRYPEARTLPDRPWYAEGALLGLDFATAALRLQQIMTDRPPEAAPLASYERDGLAASVALFNPFERTETEIHEIAEAVGAGRRRLDELAESPGDALAVATAAGLGGFRRSLFLWIASREPARLGDWLSVRELLWLGLPQAGAGDGDSSRAAERLSGWGAYAGRIDGCLCLRLAPPQMRWENWRGRAGSGLVAALAADLTLWVGEGLAVRGLPVSLSGPVLEVAMRPHARPGPTDARAGLEHGPALPLHAQRSRLRGLRVVADGDGLPASRRRSGPLRPGRRPPGAANPLVRAEAAPRSASGPRTACGRTHAAPSSRWESRRPRGFHHRLPAVLFALATLGTAASRAPGQEAPPALTFASPDGSRALESTERLSVVLPPGYEEHTVRIVFSVDGRRVCVAEAAPFECSWDFGGDGQARVIRAVAELDDDTRLVARVHTPMRMSIRFRTSVERVMVPAVVTDRRGRYLAELPAERFVVLEDGAPQDISYFEAPADRSQLDLAIAIDISGSMAPVMPGLKTSVKALLASLRPDDMVTLLAFNERTFLLSRQEPDRAELASLIDGLQPVRTHVAVRRHRPGAGCPG